MQFQSKYKVAQAFTDKLLVYADQEWAIVALGYESVPIAYDMSKALHMPLDMVASPQFWQPEHLVWRQVIAVADETSPSETIDLLATLVKKGVTRLILVSPSALEKIPREIEDVLEKQYFLDQEAQLGESSFSIGDVKTMLAHK